MTRRTRILGLRALGLALLLALPGFAATGAPVAFDFDSSTQVLDPVFSKDGVVVWFRNDATVAPTGHVQWLGPGAGPPATPYSGAGHLRLSRSAPGGGAVTSDVYFMPSLSAFTLRAFQLDCYEGGRLPLPARCDNPLVIDVYGQGGVRLATLRTLNPVAVHPGGPAPDASDYELLSFGTDEPIVRLRIRGDSNRSAFDQLVVTPYGYSCGLGFELALVLPCLAAVRRRQASRAARSSS